MYLIVSFLQYYSQFEETDDDGISLSALSDELDYGRRDEDGDGGACENRLQELDDYESDAADDGNGSLTEVASDEEEIDNYDDVDMDEVRREYWDVLKANLADLKMDEAFAQAFSRIQSIAVNVLKHSTTTRTTEISKSTITVSETVSTTTLTSIGMTSSPARLLALMSPPARPAITLPSPKNNKRRSNESRAQPSPSPSNQQKGKNRGSVSPLSMSDRMKRCSVVLKRYEERFNKDRYDENGLLTIDLDSSADSVPSETTESPTKSTHSANTRIEAKKRKLADGDDPAEILNPSKKHKSAEQMNTSIEDRLVPITVDPNQSGVHRITPVKFRRTLQAAHLDAEAESLKGATNYKEISMSKDCDLFYLPPAPEPATREPAESPSPLLPGVQRDFLKPQRRGLYVKKPKSN